MKRIKRFSIAAMMVFAAIAARGQDFNPTSPAEPGVPPSRLTLLVEPAEAGDARGGGWYEPSKKVSVYTYANTGFQFDYWSNTKGEKVASTSSFYFEKGQRNDTLVAHFRYVPDSPTEPKDPSLVQYFTLGIGSSDGGTGYGGGRYQAGNSVWLSCSGQTGYDFLGWYNSQGELVSSSMSFSYKTTTANEVLTPRFAYNPGAPAEPNVPVLSHNVFAEATDGGYVGGGNVRVLTGKSTYLYASANTGYKFVRWLKNGEPYTTLSSFSYTMEESDVTFKAEFEFSPDSPSEPNKPDSKQYAFFLMSVIGKPGQMVKYPIYLSSLDDLYDMTFQLTFPKNLPPDLSNVAVSAKAQGYDVSYYMENDTTCAISMIGGHTPSGSKMFLAFNVDIPEDHPTAVSFPVKIKQISLTQADGSHATASTRNGRIYVYHNGDTNGDGTIDLIDKLNMVDHIVNAQTDVFIEEVSDVNDDGVIDALDCRGVVDIITQEE